MSSEEIVKLVEELNESIPVKYFNEFGDGFIYSSNGYSEIITFGDFLLWSRDDDEREFIESKNEYAPLDEFVKEKFKSFVYLLENIKYYL